MRKRFKIRIQDFREVLSVSLIRQRVFESFIFISVFLMEKAGRSGPSSAPSDVLPCPGSPPGGTGSNQEMGVRLFKQVQPQ